MNKFGYSFDADSVYGKVILSNDKEDPKISPWFCPPIPDSLLQPNDTSYYPMMD